MTAQPPGGPAAAAADKNLHIIYTITKISASYMWLPVVELPQQIWETGVRIPSAAFWSILQILPPAHSSCAGDAGSIP
jgi:hypothetical protein